MEFIDIKTSVRTAKGNGPARVLRRQGSIPAVLYGPHADTMMLSVNTKDLEKVLKNRKISQIFLNLDVQGDQKKPAMIKELQVHPVSGNYLHIDFFEIAMDRKINVKVPVKTKGKALGVERGGMLQVIRRELEVFCFPLEVPEFIEIDITNMDLGDSIHVEEIPLEGNIEIPAEVNFTVLTVLSPKMEPLEGEEGEAAEAEEIEEEAVEDAEG